MDLLNKHVGKLVDMLIYSKNSCCKWFVWNKNMERKQKITKFMNYKKPGNFMGSQACKKHPKHKQSPGVCSICLGERLSKVSISARSSSKLGTSWSTSSSSSYLSSLSSSSDSSYLSPAVNYACRLDLEPRKSIRVFKNVGQNVIKKSRSMNFGLRRRKEEGSVDENKGKNIDIKRGFWSKLFPRKSRALMQSKTIRERVIIKEVL